MNKKILYFVLSVAVIAVAVLVSSFLIGAKEDPKVNSKKHNVMYVKASNADVKEMLSEIKNRGRVTAYDNVSLAAEVSGKIMPCDIRFKEGESFKKGQQIVKIKSDDLVASIKASKSSFMQTLSFVLPDIKIDYSSEYDKWWNFFTSIDVNKTLPKLPEITNDKERVFLASNNVLTSYYNLQKQEITLSRYNIYAPFDGSFKTVNKEIGAVAQMGGELANIIRSDKLEIIVPVFPVDLQWFNIGDEVVVKDLGGEPHTATVSRISKSIDATQSVNVYLTYYVKSTDSFLEGSYVDVVFETTPIAGFQLPREAVIDGSYVYELKDGKLHKIKIDVVRQLEDFSIIQGVDSSKLIVTESLSSIDELAEYKARN